MRRFMFCLILLFVFESPVLGQFDDSGWDLVYQETFGTDFTASDGQTFGTDNWLVFQLIDGGAITVANGYAQLNTDDFWNAALIRSTNILPEEYKIRTKIGYLNYDLTNYEQADYDDPDFNDHSGYYENGVYFLTITDDSCSGGQCAENWWHYHRKMIIDVDNHLDYGGGETFHPIYMAYMAPETNSGGNLLRTWTGSVWDESAWNWNTAATYDYNTWYYAELEKKNGYLILRLYDESQNIIQETTPVRLDKINAMDNATEYLYLGEPHTDDYKGDVRIDDITLLTPNSLASSVITDFESANATNIQVIGADSISFEIRLDDLSGDTYGWYYFAVAGKAGDTITLFLTNPDAWQDANDCPRYSNDNLTWHEMADVWDEGDTVVMKHYLEEDTVWFAQSMSYTVTMFDQFLESNIASILQYDTIGYSVNSRPIKLLSITDTSWSEDYKKTVWLISRQHPMESQATYLLQGLLETVFENSEFAHQWQRNLSLKVVPIVNPDGVVEGYSRHNVNGQNLNRNWQSSVNNEQPEVNATHTAIADYINTGMSLDLFLDLHAAPNYKDYGYRMAEAHTDSVYYTNQTAFLTLMERYDSWQKVESWGELGAAGAGGGVSAWILNSLYGLDALVPENPWSRRFDNSCVTSNSLVEQGGNWARAIYDYLFPIQVRGTGGKNIDSVFVGDDFEIYLTDYLQCNADSLLVSIHTLDSSDVEQFYVINELSNCGFKTRGYINVNHSIPVAFDGFLSTSGSSGVMLRYSDPATIEREYYKFFKVVDSTVVVSVDDDNSDLPYSYVLSQNYPNPFNNSTVIRFSLPRPSDVDITIYNIRGQEITTLYSGQAGSGNHQVTWSGEDSHGDPVASGIYLYRMTTGNSMLSKKMLLLK